MKNKWTLKRYHTGDKKECTIAEFQTCREAKEAMSTEIEDLQPEDITSYKSTSVEHGRMRITLLFSGFAIAYYIEKI